MILSTMFFLAALLQVDPAVFDPDATAKLIVDAIEKGQWWIVAGPALALFIHYTKKLIAPKWPKLAEFLNQPLVAFSTPFVVAFLAGTATTFAAVQGMPGKAEWIALLSTAIKVAATAIATYVGLKKRTEQKELAVAAAAAAIVDKKTAIDELNK
ncbi:MAG: hypothetical protein WAV09_03320 [Minisyncoccia bacterium]